MNICVTVLWGIYPGTELLSHTLSDKLMSSFSDYFQRIEYAYPPQEKPPKTPNAQGHWLLFDVFTIVILGISSDIALCFEICISLVISETDHHFHMIIGHLDVVSCVLPVQVFCPLFYWDVLVVCFFLTNYKNTFCILNMSPLCILYCKVAFLAFYSLNIVF